MENKVKTIKGFDGDLKCRDYQYEIGETYKLPENETVKICERGFHAIAQEADPMSVLDYYPPAIGGKRSRYCEVEASGDVKGYFNKLVCSEIKIGAEIGIIGVVKAHIEWVKKHITNENNSDPGNAATAGDRGAATARGSVSVGKNGVATVRGNNVKAKGGMGAIITIAEENADDYGIKWWKTIVIDGDTYKPETWYGFKDGEIVEL